MKSKLLAGVAMSLGLVLSAHGQALTEYSHASSASAGAAMSAPSRSFSSASNRAPSRAYGGGSPSASRASAAGKGRKSYVWEDKSVPSKNASRAKPNPPAVFVLASGERIESNNYFLTDDSVRIEQNGTPRTIPMSSVNMDATMAANHQRGLNMKLPTDKKQIMVSF